MSCIASALAMQLGEASRRYATQALLVGPDLFVVLYRQIAVAVLA